MQVQLIHQQPDGTGVTLEFRELDHMPPVGEPFAIDQETCYKAKAYFGPDETGVYLLVLEGDPIPLRH